MSDSFITKMEQSIANTKNSPKENEHQELYEAILLLLKGKSVSLCKSVLKGLIAYEIDKKSIVN